VSGAEWVKGVAAASAAQQRHRAARINPSGIRNHHIGDLTEGFGRFPCAGQIPTPWWEAEKAKQLSEVAKPAVEHWAARCGPLRAPVKVERYFTIANRCPSV
jgi:hypothetical protein